jgi:hypothetical protein
MTEHQRRRALMLALQMLRAEALELCDRAEHGRYVDPIELDAATIVRDWSSTQPEFV